MIMLVINPYDLEFNFSYLFIIFMKEYNVKALLTPEYYSIFVINIF